MNANFEFYAPTKIYFGDQQIHKLGAELRQWGRKVLMLHGSERIKKTPLFEDIKAECRKAGLALFTMGGVEPNPRHSTVNQVAALCKKEGIEVLLAVGGGSVIDCAKFVSPAAFYGGDSWDFFSGKAAMQEFLPIVTIPTLSGTGSDMDAFGIVSNAETREKTPLYHPALFPKASFLNPQATFSVSPFQTACGAIDAFSHYLEVYFMRPNMPMLLGLMESFMRTLVRAIPVVMREPESYEARGEIMWASSWALNGLTFGPTQGTPFMCHWLEDELSAKYDLTHGLGLAIMLPHYLEYCLNEKSAPLYRDLAVQVLGIDAGLAPLDAAQAAIATLRTLFFSTCGLKSRLRDCGVQGDSDFAEMARIACRGGVMHGFVDLGQEDAVKIYQRCW